MFHSSANQCCYNVVTALQINVVTMSYSSANQCCYNVVCKSVLLQCRTSSANQCCYNVVQALQIKCCYNVVTALQINVLQCRLQINVVTMSSANQCCYNVVDSSCKSVLLQCRYSSVNRCCYNVVQFCEWNHWILLQCRLQINVVAMSLTALQINVGAMSLQFCANQCCYNVVQLSESILLLYLTVLQINVVTISIQFCHSMLLQCRTVLRMVIVIIFDSSAYAMWVISCHTVIRQLNFVTMLHMPLEWCLGTLVWLLQQINVLTMSYTSENVVTMLHLQLQCCYYDAQCVSALQCHTAKSTALKFLDYLARMRFSRCRLQESSLAFSKSIHRILPATKSLEFTIWHARYFTKHVF